MSQSRTIAKNLPSEMATVYFEPHHSFLLCKSTIYWLAKQEGSSCKILRSFIRERETQELGLSDFLYTAGCGLSRISVVPRTTSSDLEWWHLPLI